MSSGIARDDLWSQVLGRTTERVRPHATNVGATLSIRLSLLALLALAVAAGGRRRTDSFGLRHAALLLHARGSLR